jgi:hypothetical protein
MHLSRSQEPNHFLSALGFAFDILGPICKQRLYETLEETYDMDVNKTTEEDLAVIEQAITEIFGEAAAQLLMKQVYNALDRPGLYSTGN